MRLCYRHNIAEELEGSAGGGGQGRRAFPSCCCSLLQSHPFGASLAEDAPGRGGSHQEGFVVCLRGCCRAGEVTKCGGTSEAGGSGPAAPACCLITPAEAFPALPGRARQCDHASGFLARTGLPLALRQPSPSPPENSALFKKKPTKNPHTPLRARSQGTALSPAKDG